MTPALIMLIVPGLPSYNGVEVYYLKGVIGLPIVISFRDRWYTHIFFFFEMGSLMTSSAGPIQILKFPEPWSTCLLYKLCEICKIDSKRYDPWEWQTHKKKNPKKLKTVKFQVFLTRPASLAQLGLVSDPHNNFHKNRNSDQKDPESINYTVGRRFMPPHRKNTCCTEGK